jgi:hypothetical protein
MFSSTAARPAGTRRRGREHVEEYVRAVGFNEGIHIRKQSEQG